MNTLKLTVDVTAVDIGVPVALDKTPLLGGEGREGILRIPVLPITGVFTLQGAPKQPGGDAPAEGSSDWATLLTIDANAEHQYEVADLPNFIRWNTTTADGDGPDVLVYLEGTP